MELELDKLEPSVVKAACRSFAGKCLVDGDMLLYTASMEVAQHPERVGKLLERSPQFTRELLRQQEKYSH